MDYEKKYKELVGKIEKAYLYAQTDSTKAVLEEIRPELKASEDVKIRKALIDFFNKGAKNGEQTNGVYDKDILDWLEKQENRNTHLCKEDVVVKFVITEPGKYFREVSAPIEATSATYTTEVETGDGGIKALVTGKVVMPTFKVGDWITDGIFNCKITDVLEDRYIVTSKYEKRSAILFEHESRYHLWTIEDAKPGDMLCTYECDEPKIVFILKGMPKKPYVLSYHCYYNIMYPHFETDSKKGCLAPNDEDVKPATKEQRDLLFKKMKEAGYEWDAEKFEPIKVPKTKEPEGALKKLLDEQDKFYKEAKIVLENKDTALAFLRRTGIIDEYGELAEKYRSDQTPATTISAVNGANSIAITDGNTSVTSKEVEKQYCTGQYEPDVREFPIEWKEENVDELSEFERAMMHIGGSFFGEKAGLDPNSTDDVKEQAELLLSLVPKQEWSEEDKDFMYETLSNLTELKDRYGEGHGNVGNCIDWLRSIKDKVQSLSQPKEWSEEDERMRQYVVNDLRFVKELVNDPNYAVSVEMVEKEIDWMESFKERYTWKPSDEQLYFLHWLATNVLTDGEVDKKASEVLESLYQELKKLREG